MADATIGALSVILGGDATALDKMLAGAQNSVNSFAKNVSSIAGGIGLEKAISGAVSSFVGMIKEGLANADAMAKLAQSSGMAVDEVTKLKYAGDITGVSSDALGKSIQSLSMGLTDLASGKVTPASQALAAMGLNARNTDGSLKTAGQSIADIADKFASYKDGASKAALAQQLFGDGGAAMVPLLNKGRDGLAELGAEAQKYGLVLDGDTQFAVESLNDNLKRMDSIKQGLALTITAKLLPSFEQISAAMLNAKENASLMATVADSLANGIKVIISVGLQAVVVVQRLTAELGAFFGAFKSSDPILNVMQGWEAMQIEGRKTVDILKAVDTTVSGMFADPSQSWDQQAFGIKAMNSEVVKLGTSWGQTAAPIIAATDATRNALQMFIDTTAKRTAATDAEALTVGKSTAEQARMRVELEAAAIAKAKDIDLTDKMRAAITAAANASADAAQRLAGAQLTEASLAPWEARNKQLAQYNQLLDAGKISLQTFTVASLKVQFPSFMAAAQQAMDFKASIDTLATSMMNGLASTLAQVITGAKSAGDAFAAFGIQVLTQLAEMIVKALLFKLIMTAIGFAGGGPVDMSQSLSSTGFSPTTTGGLYDSGGWTGPGGKYEPAGIVHKDEDVFSQEDVARWGGIGNVERLRLGGPPALSSFAAGGAVGSRVSVPQVSAPAMMSGSPQVIELRGMKAGDLYTREHLAVLMKKLGGMMGNNYTFKVATS